MPVVVESLEWVRIRAVAFQVLGLTLSSIFVVTGSVAASTSLSSPPCVKLFMSKPGGRGIHLLMMFDIGSPVPVGLYVVEGVEQKGF